jgi:hypothetical protein
MLDFRGALYYDLASRGEGFVGVIGGVGKTLPAIVLSPLVRAKRWAV